MATFLRDKCTNYVNQLNPYPARAQETSSVVSYFQHPRSSKKYSGKKLSLFSPPPPLYQIQMKVWNVCKCVLRVPPLALKLFNWLSQIKTQKSNIKKRGLALKRISVKYFQLTNHKRISVKYFQLTNHDP